MTDYLRLIAFIIAPAVIWLALEWMLTRTPPRDAAGAEGDGEARFHGGNE